jgi:hypothetical protein
MSDPTVAHVSPSHTRHLIDLLDRPIAFHRIFVELTGSVLAAVMLSQAFYWSRPRFLPAAMSRTIEVHDP